MTAVKNMKKFKPTTPGQRGKVVNKRSKSISKKVKLKKILKLKKTSTSGRNNQGRLTVRHRGGAHKRHIRIIDFKRQKDGIKANVKAIQYDPNRSAYIALVCYMDGEYRYIVAPHGLKVGDTIESGERASHEVGNCLPLSQIRLGTQIHCVELKPRKGAQIIRSAGSSAQLLAKESSYAILRLRSGEMRKVLVDCRACIGVVSNGNHKNQKLGKAGANRWRGKRPTVRGVAMNPVDHPHGGGEGRTSGGRNPVSPKGVPTKGYKTRRNKSTTKYIVRDRRKRN